MNNGWASDMKVPSVLRLSPLFAPRRSGRGHAGGRKAPVCFGCRVTLSARKCLNRMCTLHLVSQ